MIRDVIFLFLGMIIVFIFINPFMSKHYNVPKVQHHNVSITMSATPTNIPTPKGLSSTTYQYLVETFGKDARTAIAIAHATSNFNCKYDDGNSNVGLFGINANVNPFGEIDSKNCESNIDMAKKIYDREGWKAFPKYNDGSYKKFY